MSRIRITEVGHPLCGHFAVLKRRRHSDDGAWFQIEGELTAEERDFASKELPFPVGDVRAQHVMLLPDQYLPVPLWKPTS